MKIEKHKYVTIEYSLSDDNGVAIDSSKESGPLTYLHGGGTLIPGLEFYLKDKMAGEEFKVSIPPEKGYGERDESFLHSIPADKFNEIENIQPGMEIEVQDGNSSQIMTVIKIGNDEVTLDGNHPLAGKTMNIDIKIVEVREATTEELEQFYSSKMGCETNCGDGCNSC